MVLFGLLLAGIAITLFESRRQAIATCEQVAIARAAQLTQQTPNDVVSSYWIVANEDHWLPNEIVFSFYDKQKFPPPTEAFLEAQMGGFPSYLTVTVSVSTKTVVRDYAETR
jgi:type II secretory pathway pseudopilin PulG